MARRYIKIIVHRDGAPESRSFRLPVWAARALAVTSIVVAFLIVIAAALYAPVARTALRVPGMSAEIERLTQENRQVVALSTQLTELEQRYDQIRGMLGSEVVPELSDSVIRDNTPVALPLVAAPPGEVRYDSTVRSPTYFPLANPGFVTRGHNETSNGEAHPGMDIAVRSGTPFRASAGGTVIESGVDPEYGNYVLLGHSDNYSSMYGHASRVVVATGDTVLAGEVLGLTGSTGRSTAPHLHFEVRLNGRSINPGDVLIEEF